MDDSDFLIALHNLFEDPDLDINGGDLVDAIGHWAAGDVELAVIELENML